MGGNLTLGNVSPILGKVSEGTIYDEIVKLLAQNHKDEIPVETRNGKEIHIDSEEAQGILTDLLYEQNGILPKNVSIVRLHRTFYQGERNVNATQLNEVDSLDLTEIFKAEVELRNQIL